MSKKVRNRTNCSDLCCVLFLHSEVDKECEATECVCVYMCVCVYVCVCVFTVNSSVLK